MDGRLALRSVQPSSDTSQTLLVAPGMRLLLLLAACGLAVAQRERALKIEIDRGPRKVDRVGLVDIESTRAERHSRRPIDRKLARTHED